MMKQINLFTVIVLLAAISFAADLKGFEKDKVMIDAVNQAPFFEQTLDIYLQRLMQDDNPYFIINELADKLYHYNPTFDKENYIKALQKKYGGADSPHSPLLCEYPNSQLKKQASANAAIRVNDSNSNCWNVSFAASEENQCIFVVWQDERSGLDNPDIFGQFFDLHLNPIGANFCIHSQIGSTAQINPSVTTKSDGGFVVVWEDYRNSIANIYGRCFGTDGTPESDDFIVSSSGAAALMPAIAADSLDSFIATWLVAEDDDFNIYARKFNNSGIAPSESFKVNNDENNFQWFPAIATSSTGESIIAWEDKRDGNSNIYGQRLRADGSKRAGNFRIDDAEGNNQQWKPKASFGGNNFVIVWEDYREAPNGIFAQWIDSSLMKDGHNQKVDDNYPEGLKETPSAAINSKCQTFFCWQDSRSDHVEIYGQVFDESRNSSLQLLLASGSENEELLSNQIWLYDNIATLLYIDKNASDSWQNIFAKQILFDFLPIELSAFNVSSVGNKAVCSWSTASESNNLGFIIERAFHKENFIEIGFIAGHGTRVSTSNYSFVDNDLPSGNYSYRLKQIDFDGAFSYSDIVTISIETRPNVYSLYPNHPNPFNPRTSIRYDLPKEGTAFLGIYNINGDLVRTLVSGQKTAGSHKVSWDATDDAGRKAASGVYLYRLQAGDKVLTNKLLLTK